MYPESPSGDVATKRQLTSFSLTSHLGAFFGFQATLEKGRLKFSANDEEDDNKKPRTQNDIVIRDPICCIAFN